MSVVSYERDWSGRTGEYTQDESSDTIVLDVITDNPMDNKQVVLNYMAIHGFSPGAVNPDDLATPCKRVNARQTDGPCTWKVTAEYNVARNALTGTTNPVLSRPKVGFSLRTSEEAVDYALSDDASNTPNKPVVNAAGERFDQPFTRPISDLVFTVEHNVTIAYGNLLSEFHNSVNQAALTTTDTLYSYPAETCLFQITKASVEYAGPLMANRYYAIGFEIAVRMDGWKVRRLNQGYRTKVSGVAGSPAVYRLVLDDAGHPVSKPVLLDNNGGRLASNGTPIWLTFKRFEVLDWSTMGLFQYMDYFEAP